MKELYAQQEEIDNLYLDEYEKTYELNKLMRQVSASIDESSTTQGKQRLKEIYDEINAANKEGVELSKQDLDIL
jgi:hypothetical protein